jgi:chromosome partitioning protein
MSVKIAVINQKGGVGKTTTVINVASFLGKSDRDVLILDIDPQGNATSGIGLEKHQLPLTSYDVLLDPTQTKQAITPVPKVERVSIIGSNENLAGAEVELVAQTGREQRVVQVLEQWGGDIALIDCPPALGLLTVNALTAADYVLIPVQAEYYALEGISQLLGTIKKVKETLNPNLAILGVVLTMYDSRTSLAEQVGNELRKHFGELVFKTVIPRNVRLAEAPSHGKPISEHDRWSKGARAYKQLTKEILQRIGGK